MRLLALRGSRRSLTKRRKKKKKKKKEKKKAPKQNKMEKNNNKRFSQMKKFTFIRFTEPAEREEIGIGHCGVGDGGSEPWRAQAGRTGLHQVLQGIGHVSPAP